MTARRLARQALTPLVIAAAGSLLLLTVTGGAAAAATQEEPVVQGTADLTWEPAEVQINPGDTVTFEVVGGPPHPVEPAAGGPEFDASACGLDAMSAEGDSCQITFEEEGTFPFICTVHESQGMTGTITVGEGGEAPAAPAETPTPEPSIADTPAAATSEDGPPMIYYAGWGLLALGALIALAAVVGYLRFAPDFRRGDK